MQINKNSTLKFEKVTMPGAKNVKMKILIGPQDGSTNIIMRYFSVGKNGNTPRHTHDYEHVVKIEKNKGIFIDEKGVEREVKEGMSLYVDPNSLHQFKNPHSKPFCFLCIIPNPNKNNCCVK